jgi:hypothetical protein
VCTASVHGSAPIITNTADTATRSTFPSTRLRRSACSSRPSPWTALTSVRVLISMPAGPGVTAQDYRTLDYRAPQARSGPHGATKQDLRAPDQTDGRGTGGVATPTAPQWPVNPQPIARPHSVATAKPSDGGGVDDGVWIALGAAALTVAAGIGFVGGKRVRIGRERQLA